MNTTPQTKPGSILLPVTLFLLLSTLFIASPVYGQKHDVTVQMSEQYEEPKNSLLFDIVGYDEEGFFLSRYQRRGLFTLQLELEKYSKSLKFLGLRDYEYEINGEDLIYSRGIYFGEQLYAIGSTYDKKAKQRDMYYHELDNKTMTPKGKPTLIQSFVEDRGEIAYADYEISPNETSIAFFGLPGYIEKGMLLGGIPIMFSSNKEKINGSVIVMDATMTKKWESKFELPYTEKLYDIKGVRVDDEGNFYILGRSFKDGTKTKKRGEPNYEFVITAFRSNGKEVAEYHVTLDKNFITDCSFQISPDNKLICAGFYSEQNAFSIKGTFYMRIDPSTKEVLSKNTKEFDAEFLKLFMSDNKAEKGRELANFDLDQIIVREDGGAVLIGEEYYVVVSTYYDPNSKTTRESRTYHYNDIIVININPDNTIEWATRIPKKQASSSGFYLSYATHVKDDILYLIFNDNEKNLDEKNPEKIYPYDGKNSFATLVTINPYGEWQKTALFSNKEEGVIMRPIVSEQINDNELIIYCEKGRKYVIGKISFD